mmetsp:Transcript_63642/g.207631  ORF Transcript_63642/g.207631 Transcript_63642/m.207631 type:complete len:541 (-) Transcript_63642:31-1653(-)
MARQLAGLARAAQAALTGGGEAVSGAILSDRGRDRDRSSSGQHRREASSSSRAASADPQRGDCSLSCSAALSAVAERQAREHELPNASVLRSALRGVPPGGAGDRHVLTFAKDGSTDEAGEVLIISPARRKAFEKVEFPEVINLNVGGTLLTTTLTTLQRDPRSKLAFMFSGDVPMVRDGDGRFCIDRDGRTFHHVLNFLRDASAPIGLTRSLRLELLREAHFYGLEELHRIVGGTQHVFVAKNTVEKAAQEGISTARRQQAEHLAWNRSGSVSSVGSRPSAQSSASAVSVGGPPVFEDRRIVRPLALAVADPYGQDFLPDLKPERFYIRLRYGHEYSGGWVVSSPRNLCGVDYELHDACLERGPIAAMNKMCQVGFKPAENPPRAPTVSEFFTDKWSILMYTDDPQWLAEWDHQQSSASSTSPNSLSPSPPDHRSAAAPPPMPLLPAGGADDDYGAAAVPPEVERGRYGEEPHPYHAHASPVLPGAVPMSSASSLAPALASAWPDPTAPGLGIGAALVLPPPPWRSPAASSSLARNIAL